MLRIDVFAAGCVCVGELCVSSVFVFFTVACSGLSGSSVSVFVRAKLSRLISHVADGLLMFHSQIHGRIWVMFHFQVLGRIWAHPCEITRDKVETCSWTLLYDLWASIAFLSGGPRTHFCDVLIRFSLGFHYVCLIS